VNRQTLPIHKFIFADSHPCTKYFFADSHPCSNGTLGCQIQGQPDFKAPQKWDKKAEEPQKNA
jgi:hypothetical protein